MNHRPNLPRLFVATLLAGLILLVPARLPAQAAASIPPAPAPATATQSFSLNLIDAPGGVVIDLLDFVRMLQSIYPGASSTFDSQRGMLRIEAAGHRLDALTGRPLVILDGKIQDVPRPLQVRQGVIQLPVETAQAMLRALGLNFELQSRTAPAATPVPTPPPAATPQPAMPGLPATPQPTQPSLPPGSAPTSATAATSASTPLGAPRVNLAMVVGQNEATPTPTPAPANLALQPPSGMNSAIGLTWGQLADLRHRIPPERITLVCGPALLPLAEATRDELNRSLTLRATVVTAPDATRDQPPLISRVEQSGPELLIDLLAQPPVQAENPAPLVIWTVHQALWPHDRAPHPSAGDGPDPTRAYQAHQFQSIALGSLLRSELTSRLPDRTIVYELAPDFLLRRTDAPSAAVLVPVEGTGAEERSAVDAATLAPAIAAAVADYVEGIRGAL